MALIIQIILIGLLRSGGQISFQHNISRHCLQLNLLLIRLHYLFQLEVIINVDLDE